MKEEIKELESLLANLLKTVAQQIEVRQIDMDEFDRLQLQNFYKGDDDERYKLSMAKFREDIVAYKADKSFYEVDVPHLKGILSDSLEQLKLIDTGNAKQSKALLPDKDIIELIKQKILTTESIVKAEMNGKEFCGHLTEDGFLEITFGSLNKKYGSLRRAAFELWGRDNPSQWKFWKVDDKPLEYYRNLIKHREA